MSLCRVLYRSKQNSQTLNDCIVQSLRYFVSKLQNFTKFILLFPKVLMTAAIQIASHDAKFSHFTFHDSNYWSFTAHENTLLLPSNQARELGETL